MTPHGLAPPPTLVGDRTIVAVELRAVEATLVFDATARRASVEAAMTFTVPSTGHAAFDLRQPIGAAHLDGRALPPAALTAIDMGGGPGANLRVMAEPCDAGAFHRLELAYELGTPDVADAQPVGWDQGAVHFDVWCSDLFPGRYLEQWLPVGLCQDRFALTLDVAVVGVAAEHRLVANAGVVTLGDHHWQVAWPDHHTSLSSLLVIAPTHEGASACAGPVELTTAAGVDEDAHGLAEKVAGWLEANATRLGPYRHRSPFVAHVWASTRGMEYDGATTGSVHSMEHEVFHSWFGRGVKPASANDGWIDEAVTTWATSDSGPDETPRLAAVPMALDDPPVLLAPTSPWSRHTPREAYRTGYRLFANFAHLAGGADPVLDALAGIYQAHAGGFLSTGALRLELSEALSFDVGPWWDRYVLGQAG